MLSWGHAKYQTSVWRSKLVSYKTTMKQVKIFLNYSTHIRASCVLHCNSLFSQLTLYSVKVTGIWIATAEESNKIS